eukprot:TRINITY_DN45599_c0_g1_i1.p1 TRINITY_DN45599_c0_g1~~TRINITY_DN45599_c0_g1_i1.p1  ORF type:complete len:436 (-),score=64.19 TRINITY_DN45599_c0_g1_i1:77-1384(-)
MTTCFANEAQGPWRGVNLGGWLVLESWMTPGLFERTVPDAVDELTLLESGGQQAAVAVTEHRETFITERDFWWMRHVGGLNAVRLPVGFWCLEEHAAETPFLPTRKYVDRVFEWAEAHGLRVILELHGACGSQNSKDHSGQSDGGVHWLDQANRCRNLDVLKSWAKRWGRHPALLALGVGNEVAEPEKESAGFWTNLQDQVMSSLQVSCTAAPQDYWSDVADFYEEVASLCRPYLRKTTPLIIDTCWDIDRWALSRVATLEGPVWLDFHHYECFGETLDVQTHCKADGLREVLGATTLPTIIGEFSLAMSPEADGYVEGCWEKRFFEQQVSHMSSKATGWFFWNYRLGREDWHHWSYRASVERGWIQPAAWTSAENVPNYAALQQTGATIAPSRSGVEYLAPPVKIPCGLALHQSITQMGAIACGGANYQMYGRP